MQYDAYVRQISRHLVPHTVVPAAVRDMEVDELAQRTRIKIWQAFQQQYIQNPRAYITRIAHNEALQMLYRQKRAVPLPLDVDGELYTGEVVTGAQGHSSDPSEVIEQAECAQIVIEKAVTSISSLPPAQRRAVLCILEERVDDRRQFDEACRNHNIDLDAFQWPKTAQEKQILQASLTVARKKLRSLMSVAKPYRSQISSKHKEKEHEEGHQLCFA